MKKNWYILRTKPLCEKKLAIFIDKNKLEYYLPLRVVYKKWNDRIKKLQTPLLPGYMFIYGDVNSKNIVFESGYAWYYVMQERKHAYLKEEDLNLTKRIEKYEGEVNLEKTLIKKGQKIEVISGALKGVRGTAINDEEESKIYIGFSIIETGFIIRIKKTRVKFLENNNKKVKIVAIKKTHS